MEQVSLWVILLLIVLVCVPFIYKDLYLRRKLLLMANDKFKIVGPLLNRLALKEPIHPGEIFMLAKDPVFRSGLRHILQSTDSLHLFPSEYESQEKAAEAYLANWLEFPTELGSPPDEMELLTRVIIHDDGELVYYYVFRFRQASFSLHGKKIWMLGVVGPYQNDTLPYELPLRVFSRFMLSDDTSPQAEVKWVHENIRAFDKA